MIRFCKTFYPIIAIGFLGLVIGNRLLDSLDQGSSYQIASFKPVQKNNLPDDKITTLVNKRQTKQKIQRQLSSLGLSPLYSKTEVKLKASLQTLKRSLQQNLHSQAAFQNRSSWTQFSKSYHDDPKALSLWNLGWSDIATKPLNDKTLWQQQDLVFLAINGAKNYDQKTFYAEKLLLFASTEAPEQLNGKPTEKDLDPLGLPLPFNTSKHEVSDYDIYLKTQILSVVGSAQLLKEDIRVYETPLISILNSCYPTQLCGQTQLALQTYAPETFAHLRNKLKFNSPEAAIRFDKNLALNKTTH